MGVKAPALTHKLARLGPPFCDGRSSLASFFFINSQNIGSYIQNRRALVNLFHQKSYDNYLIIRNLCF